MFKTELINRGVDHTSSNTIRKWLATGGTTAKRWVRNKWTQTAIVIGTMTVAALVVGQTTPPVIPPTNLATDPLFAAASGDKPAIALALSVEFPTVGAQYTLDDYSNDNEYLGYYDAEACYNYNNAPTEAVATGLTAADYKRFDRVGRAIALAVPSTTQPTKTSRKCADAFSGNYLNWATNSGIDMLRLALSGGDRYIDEVGLTVLQRAVLPNGDPRCFWNSGNFPAKQLRKDGGGVGTYYGAVPTAMITAAAGSNIWVANTLNQIFFGTSQTGGCGNTGAYNLGAGVPAVAKQIGTPIGNRYLTPSTGQATFAGTYCSDENTPCAFTGVKEVLYGAAGTSGGWITFPASGGLQCSNSMTGSTIDPAPGVVKKCYIKDNTTSWTPTPGTAGINSEGFFYSRVQVCNAVAGVLQDTRDYSFCSQYGSNYKPTGAIQRYSEQLRIASMGYLMDQTQSYATPPGRFGGVLRAPMKYVGAKTFDIAGRENTPTSGNPNAEWDKATGIFFTNPDGDTTQNPPISGVINYLNKFGRIGPVPGRYKIYDPVGELYHETLRYLQGMPPSADAVSNITTAMYDGFPVYTTSEDPYGGTRTRTADYSCLKSNIVVIGDVNTHDGNRLPAANTAANIPNFAAWTSLVQNFENNVAATYIDGQGVSRTAGNPNAANSSAPGNIVPGAAYWAHTQDIRGTAWTNEPNKQRPGLRVKSFFFDVNENSSSTNQSYRRNQNQFFMGAKYGGFNATPATVLTKPYNTFGNPFKREDGTNDNNVWQDPANPGEAKAFYLQSSARELLGAFDDIFKIAGGQANSIAGLAVTTSTLRGSASIYIAAFDADNWSGSVSAIPITVNASASVSLGAGAWNAATQLDGLATPATSRNIIVGRQGATTVPNATPFTWANILDQSLKDGLNKSSPTATTDTLGQDRLNYLRGDRTKENNPFRARKSLLGDVINSGIAYSGTPTAVIDGGVPYKTFRTATAGRTPAVFVGANDGMMHAFNATTGAELFGYIPSWLGPKLSALTDPNYIINHQAYVDASPVVESALVGAAWKTVLVSGTGAGGRGVFALDVTSPSSFGAGNVMWEFTQADDADMGFVIGKPQILKLRTTAQNVTPAVYKWFAVVASGVNNYVPDSAGRFSTTGRPALFLLDLNKAVGSSWVENSNYYKLSVPGDSTLEVNNAAGLINFEGLIGSNGEVQAIYMGDLFGKLWKLDFTLAGIADWNFNFLSFKKSGAAIPMFVAKTAAGLVQPITAAPTIIKGPKTIDGRTFYIYFGTGRYIEATDKTTTLQNSAYMVYDNAVATSTNAAGEPLIKSRARLQLLAQNTTTGVITSTPFVWGRAATDGDTTQRSGWYFDFAANGERQIFSGDQVGQTVRFTTLTPAAAGASGSCLARSGSGSTYKLSITTGGGRFNGILGIPGQQVFFDNPDLDIVIQKADSTGRRIVKKLISGVQGTNETLLPLDPDSDSPVAGRLSWRQINNYQERKNAP